MSNNGTLKYGLSPTVRLANNISPFAAVFPLKEDDPDRHAREVADLIGTDEFSDAVSEMALIHLFSFSRISKTQVLLQTNFDSDIVAYFEAFEDIEEGFREILRHFEGAPGPDAAFTQLLEFVASCQVDIIAYFCAYPELTVTQIRRDVDWRLKVMDMQKSLAKQSERVAWGQAVSGF